MYYNPRLKRRFISFRIDEAFARSLSREVQADQAQRKAIKRALNENPR